MAMTYALWRKCYDFGEYPLTEPRTCVEAMLKALVVYYYEIDECSKITLQILKNRSEVPLNITGDFGFSNALAIVQHKDNRLFSKELQKRLIFINETAIDFTHTPSWRTNETVVEVNDCLQEVVNWFFHRRGETDWYERRIQPELDRAAQSILAQIRSGDTRNEVSEVPLGLIKIDKLYWENLLSETSIDKKEIYLNFLLKADESYTHHYIANEGKLNTHLCETLESQRLETYSGGRMFKSTINELLFEKHDSTNADYEVVKRKLIKVFAPSGEGKTVLLTKIAYKYSTQQEKHFIVYWIDSINEKIIEYLYHEITTKNVPVLILLDTPSQYDSDLTHSWNNLIKSVTRVPFIVVFADQKDRYQRTLLNKSHKDLEYYFQEKYQIHFNLDMHDRTMLTERFQEALSFGKVQIPKEHISESFFRNDSLSTRERIREIIKENKLMIKVLHRDDWDTFEIITSKPKYEKFEKLFPFIATFSLFDIGVPIDLFENGYIEGLSSYEIRTFVSSDSQNIIRLTQENKLILRHEQISKWYFDDERNRDKGKDIYRSFIKKFRFVTDSEGYYLFRNTHAKIQEKDFLRDCITPGLRKIVLVNFVNQTQFDETTKANVTRARLTLCKLEISYSEKIKWIDPLIALDATNIYPRVHKIHLLIQRERFEEAMAEIELIRDNNEFGHYVIELELKLSQSGERLLEMIKRMVGDDMELFQLITNYGNYKLEDVLSTLMRKGIDMNDPLNKWRLAHYYFKSSCFDFAITLLKELCEVDKSPSSVHLLLFQCYFQIGELDKAEEVLIHAKSFNEEEDSYYVNLSKLYRSEEYEQKYEAVVYEKMLTLFSAKDRYPVLVRSCHFRLEYAKWCYYKHPFDKQRHEEAERVLLGTLETLDPSHLYTKTELGVFYQVSRFRSNLMLSIKYLEDACSAEEKELEFSKGILCTAYRLMNSPIYYQKAKDLLMSMIAKEPDKISTLLALVDVHHYFGDSENEEKTRERILVSPASRNKDIIILSEKYKQWGDYDMSLACLETRIDDKCTDRKILINAADNLLQKFYLIRADVTIETNKKNELLETAIGYLTRISNYENDLYLHLVIKLHDAFLYDMKMDYADYEKQVQLRNLMLIKAFESFPNSLPIIVLLADLLINTGSFRLAIELINSVDFALSPPYYKISALLRLKIALRYLHDAEAISAIDQKAETIFEQHPFIRQNIKERFRKIRYIPSVYLQLESRTLIGQLFHGLGSLKEKGSTKVYSIRTKIQNAQINSDTDVFFSVFKKSNNGAWVDNIEMFFNDTNMKDVLYQSLSTELNIFDKGHN